MGELPASIGKYQIDSVLGRGGMGEVYKAHDAALGRYVALKIMRGPSLDQTNARERFIREAQAAGGLRHPNIVTVYDLGEVEGSMFIAMELISGEDLEKLIKNRTPLTIDEKLNIMIQACEGMSYAHKHQIVHRDLKPSNIRIDEEGVVKIMDFGIAKVETSNMTATGTVIGTPFYMSPEQVRGMKVDARSDIFALGAILYELFAYEKAFSGEMTAVFYKIAHENPAPLSDHMNIPSEPLQKIVDACLAKDKANRFQTMAELAALLREAQLHYRSANESTLVGVRTITLSDRPEGFHLAPTPAAVSGSSRKTGAFATPAPGTSPMSVPQTSAQSQMQTLPPAASNVAIPAPTPAPGGTKALLILLTVLVFLIAAVGGGYYVFVARPKLNPGQHPPASTQEQRDLLMQAKALHQAGKYEEAIRMYQKLEQLDPEDPDVHFLIGAAKLKIGQNQDAMSEFQRAVELNPKLDKAWQQIGLLLFNRSDWKGAENAFERALEVNPQSGAAWEGLAQTYLISQQDEKAEAAYRKLLQIEPNNVQAVYNLGLILSKKNPADAKEYFEKAIRLNPNFAEAHNNLGTLLLDQGQVGPSILENEKAVQLKPGLAPAQYSLFRAYEQQRDLKSAADHLQKYLDITNDPDPNLKRKLETYSHP